MTPMDKLRDAIQAVLDSAGDGWHLAHYVVVTGIQRLNSEGHVDTAVWTAAPIDQAEYITDGLLTSAEEIRSACQVDNDDD